MDKATLEPAMETGPEKAKASWQEYAYAKELPDDIAPFKQLLQQYSKVPPDKVDALLVRTVRHTPAVDAQCHDRR